MRRSLAFLLAAATLAVALGGLVAIPDEAEPAAATESEDAPYYGPHRMLPNPEVYPRPPFEEPAGWTGTPPGTRAGGSTIRATGSQDVLVLMIDFTDEAGAPARVGQIGQLMNDASPGATSVRNYYLETSWAQLTLTGTVENWVQANNPMTYYGRDSSPSSVDDFNGPIYRLVVEAVQKSDAAGTNFAPFDGDSDGVVDHVVVVHSGPAQEDSTNADAIWSHRWSVVDADPSTPGSQRLMADGVQIYGYIMVSETSPIGVVVHELGHDFGLPDLYDTDGSTDGIGEWDVMATGSWNALSGQNRGTMPAHFSAWCKIEMGWVQPITVSAAALGQAIDQMETRTPSNGFPRPFKLPIRTTTPEEYFLVENRELIGFDQALPGDGLMIWHVDEGMQGNSVDSHRLVDLEEADGNDRPTQSTDPWKADVDGFGPESNPSSNSYMNQRTGWKVRNISAAGAAMTADLSREVDDDLLILGIQREWMVPAGGNAFVNVTVGNRGAREQTNFRVNLTVYRDTYAAASAMCCADQTVASLVRGATVNLSWTVPVATEGKYILEATVPLALDEIPENNFMFGHVNAGVLYFHDDVESGDVGWGRNGGGNDPAIWDILQDGTTGGSHTGSYAWNFGRQIGICLLCPEFHTLTSPVVNVPAGPVYLYLWHRYDFRGRTELNGSAETDVAYLNVSFDGTWRNFRTFTNAQSGWELVDEDLSAWVVGASQIVIELSASSDVFTDSGGWWVDDIVITRTPLRPGLVARAVNPTVTVEPGGVAFFRFKIANVGDADDEIAFDLQPPTGWDAAIGQNESEMYPYNGITVALRPDTEATLILGFAVAVDAPRGSRWPVPVTASSILDTSVYATFDTLTIINDPFGLAGLEKYMFLFLIVFAAVIVIAVVIDSIKKQKGTYRRW